MTDEQLQRIHEIEYSCDSRAELAERIVGLEEENAKLVSILHEVEDEAILAFNSLREDCETITASSQHFFDKWWHAECEADRLKAENAKLRACLGNGCADCAVGMGEYADSICDQTKAENAKLREELAQWERLTAGIELPDYPICEFKPKDLERENAKLRELVNELWSLAYGYAPYEGELDYARDMMRELGIEVDA